MKCFFFIRLKIVEGLSFWVDDDFDLLGEILNQKDV